MRDIYLLLQVSTTCDEHGVYVTKDSAESIKLSWIGVDSRSLQGSFSGSALVRPVNTPLTELCTTLTGLTWDHVKDAGNFRDAIIELDNSIHEHILSKDLSFDFVVLDAWDLRVQIPREARDKGITLPSYLQYPRLFEFKREFTRWQSYHPESIPFASTSLTTICAALDIDLSDTLSPSSQMPALSSSFGSMPIAPSGDSCKVLMRALIGLKRKCEPDGSHPTVFKRPMDAWVDIQAFFAERSKVIHMSGLPQDTTQSELESWYTQHGGRPIAFWTFRTVDQHKTTGSGLAVFSTHEEALESLKMSGRALGEKAIEISPSTGRILDKAAQILTPFPPSKNRPRPGDWNCPSCGFSNFQRRLACFRCSYPAIQTNNGTQISDVSPYGINSHNQSLGNQNTLMNQNNMRSGGSGVPFRAGDWKCRVENCGYHNFAKNMTCLRCGAGRSMGSINDPVSMQNGNGNTALHQQQNGRTRSYGGPIKSMGQNIQPQNRSTGNMSMMPDIMNSMYGSNSYNGTASNLNGSTAPSYMSQSLDSTNGAVEMPGRARSGSDYSDWVCACGFSNFQRRSHCLRCDGPSSFTKAAMRRNNSNGIEANSFDESGVTMPERIRFFSIQENEVTKDMFGEHERIDLPIASRKLSINQASVGSTGFIM